MGELLGCVRIICFGFWHEFHFQKFDMGPWWAGPHQDQCLIMGHQEIMVVDLREVATMVEWEEIVKMVHQDLMKEDIKMIQVGTNITALAFIR